MAVQTLVHDVGTSLPVMARATPANLGMLEPIIVQPGIPGPSRHGVPLVETSYAPPYYVQAQENTDDAMERSTIDDTFEKRTGQPSPDTSSVDDPKIIVINPSTDGLPFEPFPILSSSELARLSRYPSPLNGYSPPPSPIHSLRNSPPSPKSLRAPTLSSFSATSLRSSPPMSPESPRYVSSTSFELPHIGSSSPPSPSFPLSSLSNPLMPPADVRRKPRPLNFFDRIKFASPRAPPSPVPFSHEATTPFPPPASSTNVRRKPRSLNFFNRIKFAFTPRPPSLVPPTIHPSVDPSPVPPSSAVFRPSISVVSHSISRPSSLNELGNSPSTESL